MMERRYFLMTAAGALAVPKLASANDTVRVGCVGVRGQGRSHLQQYGRMKNVEIAAICDIDESILNDRLSMVEKASGKRPQAFTDLRKMLEDKSIDAVSIATPNHNHTLQAIWSMQAGKDVYVEKPCSHNIFECRQIVAAAQRYGRIVQHGVNARSSPGVQEAVQKMRDGVIGDVYMARALCFKWRDTIGRKPVSKVPPGVHYDLWLGPAPLHEFTENRFHYNWHWFWDYGNGDIGNQGIHEMDIARWGLGVKYPVKVSSTGSHFMFDDDQETPNTMISTFEFNDGGKKRILTFEVRHWMSNHEAGINEGGARKDPNTIGNLWYGSKGYLAVEGYDKYYTFLGKDQQPGPKRNEGGNNWQNFIDVLRSRKREEQNNPIEEGAISVVLMHLANISYRVGRSIQFDSEKMQIVGDAEANRLLTRNYRKGFEVPAKLG